MEARYTLTEDEVREAVYGFFVRKFKSNNINAFFSKEQIDMEFTTAEIKITENTNIE